MKRLFINYRTEDTGFAATLLARELRDRLVDDVFLDHASIEGGEAWPARLREEIARADVVVALVGDRWLKTQDPKSGERRISLPEDWVRQELETAHARGVPILPHLVEGAAPPDLAPDVRAALAARRKGASFMIAALQKPHDFLDDVLRGPPVGPLAEALAAIGDKRAAPLLAEHLASPETSSVDVERAAAALRVLAGPAELPALRAFFAAYRSEPSDTAIVLAVAHVAGALVRLGAADVVTSAVKDPFTSSAVRAKLDPAGLTTKPPPWGW